MHRSLISSRAILTTSTNLRRFLRRLRGIRKARPGVDCVYNGCTGSARERRIVVRRSRELSDNRDRRFLADARKLAYTYASRDGISRDVLSSRDRCSSERKFVSAALHGGLTERHARDPRSFVYSLYTNLVRARKLHRRIGATTSPRKT